MKDEEIVRPRKSNSSFDQTRFEILFSALLAVKTDSIVVRVFADAVQLLCRILISFCFRHPLSRLQFHRLLFHAPESRA